MRELFDTQEKIEAARQAQRMHVQDLYRRAQAAALAAQKEEQVRARFSLVQQHFGTAVALLDRARWNLRKLSQGEMGYLMRCGAGVRTLSFNRCKLPEGFGKVIAEVFPRLARLYVRHTNFSDDDLKALYRSSISVIDARNTRLRNSPQKILAKLN